MNAKTQKLVHADKKYIWHPFTQMLDWLEADPVIIESGDGFYLIDTEGNRYIDGVSSLWCNVHGHRVPKIDQAIRNQLDKISHSTLLGLGQTKSIELAEKLIKILPQGLEKVFYSDAGATSVEIAIKMAYQYYRNRGEKSKKKFIALTESYHGDTIGSVSVGGIQTFHRIFGELLFQAEFAPSPHQYRFDGDDDQCRQFSLDKIEEILRNQSENIAAVIAEPLVQGAAGIIVHPAGFLAGLRELTRKYGVLLIADEVATGFGRTGKMFACQHEDVSPDIICLAKGITGGYLPLAATITTTEIFDSFLGEISETKTFFHGHTYTGNALACAAAIANLELFEENKVIESLPPKIRLIDEYLKRIENLPNVGNVRQKGLMAGIEIVKDKITRESFSYEKTIGAKLCSAMRLKGAMMRPLSDVIVLMPPVAIDLTTLKNLLDIVVETIENDLPEIIKNA
jgi:adenosylmethionine-8-amino-7-oxononanoate aminotransferase